MDLLLFIFTKPDEKTPVVRDMLITAADIKHVCQNVGRTFSVGMVEGLSEGGKFHINLFFARVG